MARSRPARETPTATASATATASRARRARPPSTVTSSASEPRHEHAILSHVQALENKVELRRAESGDAFEALRAQIEAKVDNAIQASNSSASKVHKRLDGLAETLAEARGESKSTNEQVGEIRRM